MKDHKLSKLTVSSTCVASVFRSIALLGVGAIGPSWRYLPSLFWGTIEINLAIICSCLPTCSSLASAITRAFCGSRSTEPGRFEPTLSRHPLSMAAPSRISIDPSLVPQPLAIRTPRIPTSGRNSNSVSLRVIQLSEDGIVRLADKELIV